MRRENVLALVLLLLASSALAADRIILRNLELISDRTVVAVDEDGARLDAARENGRDRVTWDEVERGRVSPELQAEFDRLTKELGPPLYRLRQRLRIGDYPGLTAIAEELYPRFAERRSQTAYLVCQSFMWGLLAEGRREEAVEPFLRCVLLLKGENADASLLPGSRRLALAADVPLCADLPPVWFDSAGAKEVLPKVATLAKEIPAPRPSEIYVYYASLAAAAGEFDTARKMLDAIPEAYEGPREVREILRAALEVQEKTRGGRAAALAARIGELPPAVQPLAHYITGLHLAQGEGPDARRDGLLELLSIAAEEDDARRELAAAAVHQGALIFESMNENGGRDALRKELATRFAGTAVAIQITERKSADPERASPASASRTD